MTARPIVHFGAAEFDGDSRPFEPTRVTGTFRIGGKEIELTMPMVKQAEKQSTPRRLIVWRWRKSVTLWTTS